MNTYEGRVDGQDPGKKGRREGWQILVQEGGRRRWEGDGRREVYRGEKRKHMKGERGTIVGIGGKRHT